MTLRLNTANQTKNMTLISNKNIEEEYRESDLFTSLRVVLQEDKLKVLDSKCSKLRTGSSTTTTIIVNH